MPNASDILRFSGRKQSSDTFDGLRSLWEYLVRVVVADVVSLNDYSIDIA
jgi:hypothetical protein